MECPLCELLSPEELADAEPHAAGPLGETAGLALVLLALLALIVLVSL